MRIMLLSIGMMVKNEEKYLNDCLSALNPILKTLNSELIIVDTGSTDKTVDIAKKYTEKVYFHKWNNNFSAMRNITLSYCSGDWFFCVDGDEILEDSTEIINFFNSGEYKKYNTATISIKSFTNLDNMDNFSVFDSLRLFYKDKDFKFVNAVHNQPLFKEPIKHLNVTCKHYGYIINDKKLMQNKFIRTSTILRKELEKDPDNIYYRHQLSVSYSMYNDHENSLKEAQKAYKSIKKQKLNPKEYIYLYYQLASEFINNKRYEEAEKICKEGINLEDDYIDLYYCLGYARMMLGKRDKSNSAYKKYLELIRNYDRLPIRSNTSVIFYTLGFSDTVFYNSAISYCKDKKYNEALEMLNKIISQKDIESSADLYIGICFDLNNFKELKGFYEKNIVNSNKKDEFLVSLEKRKNELKDSNKRKFFKIFSNGNDDYFRLNNIRISYVNGDANLYNMIIKFMNSINMNDCQDYYGDLIYYLMNIKKSIADFMINVAESNINKYFNYIFKIYDDSLKVALDYLSTIPSDSFVEKRINRTICKWILVSNKISDSDYSKIFHKYIDNGTGYISILYNENILKNEFIYDLKNNDEAFFLYIYLAKMVKESDKAKYIFYLKKALNLCPFMSKGIEILLNEFEINNKKINCEFENYKILLKQKIKQLVENNNIDEALNIINEYEKIIKDDIEIYSIKGCILIEKGKFIEAEKILKQGLNINNRNFDLNYDMAYLYENISKYELSLEYYKRAIETTKDESMINEINSEINIILNKLNLPLE